MICLDSTVIIDFLKGRKEAVAVVQAHKKDNYLFATEISVFEVFTGIYLKEEVNEQEVTKASEFFNSLNILPFDESCGHEAARIHASLIKSWKMIEEADIFISVIMKKNGCNKIITRNKEHFSRIKGIRIIEY